MSNLEEYVTRLDHADEAERLYAAEDIGYLNAAEGVPPLLARVGTEASRAVRDVIFQALARIDADAAIEGSIRLLGSDDPQIRNQAVDVLRHKGSRSIPYLNRVMRDGDKNARKLVLDALTEVRAGEAHDIYAAALSDKDLNVVITAVENLGRMRAVEFRYQIECLLQVDSHPMLIAACMEALVGIGNESSLQAIRRCFAELAALPDFLLASCLKAIAVLGSEKEFAEVANLLLVRGPHLRPAILNALTAMHPRCSSLDAGESLLPAVRTVIEDGDPPLCRYQAVRLLGFWSIQDDVYGFMVSCLSNPEPLVRLGAAESLRMTGRPGFELALAERALKETDDEVLEALRCSAK
jgi:HEAT repeat protein